MKWLLILLLLVPLVACQSEAYKKAYPEAIAKGFSPRYANYYARAYGEAYYEAIADGKDEAYATAYAQEYAQARTAYAKVRREYATDRRQGRGEVYAQASAQAIAEGKSEAYAQTYAQAIADGKDRVYAQAIADGKGEAYATAYAQAIADRKTATQAHAYAEARVREEEQEAKAIAASQIDTQDENKDENREAAIAAGKSLRTQLALISLLDEEDFVALSKIVVPFLIEIQKLEKKVDRYPNDVAASNSPEFKELINTEKYLHKILPGCYYTAKFSFEEQKACMGLCQEPYPLSKKQYASDLYICELQILGALSGCY